MHHTSDRPLSVGEVADLLGVAPSTVVGYADSGLLRCFKLPGGHRRFQRADVDELIAKGLLPDPAPAAEAAS